jgi:hypothetical protein
MNENPPNPNLNATELLEFALCLATFPDDSRTQMVKKFIQHRAYWLLSSPTIKQDLAYSHSSSLLSTNPRFPPEY